MKYQRGEGGTTTDNANTNNEAADPAAREAAIRRAAAEFTPERRAFLEKALAEYTRDHAQRMREITEALNGEEDKGQAKQGAAAAADAATTTTPTPTPTTTTLEQKEELLDELHDIVENIDHARDLVKIGGLPTLLRLLRSPHASLRWRAADVVAASAANNPPVQRWLLGAGTLPPLMALLELSAEAAAFPENSLADLLRARTKAVHALSAMVRHHDGGFDAFRQLGGLAQLCRLEGGPDLALLPAEEQDFQVRRRLLRKELELLRYALEREPADCKAAAALGTAERAAAAAGLWGEGGKAASNVCPDLRSAALTVLLELAQHPQAWAEVRRRCPDLAGQLSVLAAQEDGGDVARDLAARLGPNAKAPAKVKAPRRDHIDLDPHDHGTHKSIPLKRNELQQAAAAAAGGGGAAAAPPPLLGAPPP
jgi:hsp70-interacting protein